MDERDTNRPDEQQDAEAPAADMTNEEAMEVEEELTDGSGFPG